MRCKMLVGKGRPVMQEAVEFPEGNMMNMANHGEGPERGDAREFTFGRRMELTVPRDGQVVMSSATK